MLRILLTCLLICPALTWAEGDDEGSLFQRFSSAMSDMSRKTLYGALCDQFTDAPACYVTPSGKKIWELDEPERSRWLAIAQSSGDEGAPAAVVEAKSPDDVPIAAAPRALTEEEWATLRQQESALFCDFWRQQGDSERTREQVARYCQ